MSFLPSYARDLSGSNDDGPGGGPGGGGGTWIGPESDQILSISTLNPLKPEERERLDNRWGNFLGKMTRALTGAGDDVLDGSAAFTGGLSEFLTGGLSSRFNDWMYGDIHAQNQESWFWTAGQMTGLAASFVLPGGSAQAACKASGLVRGFSAFNQGMMWAGAAESVANIASTGEVTFGDAIGLLGPLSHALGKRTGKMYSNGGCFVAGTPVALAALPQGWQGASRDPWAETTWLESFLAEEREFSAPLAMPAPEAAALAVAAELAAAVRIAIEQVPVGARVQTRNPRRWEYDDSLPEPDEANWAKLSITVQRSDGGVVDAELLRPRAWIERHGIVAGQLLPLHLPELEVSGQALVTAVEACPPIAGGEGSVVTARFVTREVHVVASVEVLGPDGSVETITGTTIHPVWSVDREDWVPLGELVQGETLQGEGGLAVVLSITLSRVAQPVYNLEVHGEHVYQVGQLGVLVHNAGEECELLRNAPSSAVGIRPSPGVTVRKVGNYWIKEVDQNAGALARWHGERSLRIQSEALTKLGDMAPSHLLKNGKLITRDAGTYTPGNFWSTWAKGSWRLGTPVNDIRPRNIGANGLIFDPAIDPLVRPLYWTAGGGVVVAGGWGIYELFHGEE